MNREYHRWHSRELGREMEMLVFGHGGLPAIVFPTSQARFYEFEDRGMVATVADKIDAGQLQLFCVDTVDAESWYNRGVGADWRVARQAQYDLYIAREVAPFVRWRNQSSFLIGMGCSLGGYHAVNCALKHPDVFTGFLSMSGVFDMQKLGFLPEFYDANTFYNLPLDYLAGLEDDWFLSRMRRGTYVLATGEHDQCWNDNERLAAAMRAKNIPVRLEVWGYGARHDWPWWQQMLRVYL